MRNMRDLIILSLGLTFLGLTSLTQARNTSEEEAITGLKPIYTLFNKNKATSVRERINQASGWFIGKPYLLGALGEGVVGEYDKFPLYRIDAFDCQTYVETVLAVALTEDASEFERCIRRIRYNNGKIEFSSRNHFTSLDWNPNNQRLGLIEDYTEKVVDEAGHPVFKIATALIDKPAWYNKLPEDTIRITNLNKEQREIKHRQLREEGKAFNPQNASIPYLPFSVLFSDQGDANEMLFKQIPDGAIIEIVRPNWDLTKETGTHLNVSHMGFAFWRNGNLMFRDASLLQKSVVDENLVEYLKKYLKSPTIRGINIQVVVPEEINESPCK